MSRYVVAENQHSSCLCPTPGEKRPFSATGGNADICLLSGGGGKGIAIPRTSEGREGK